MINASKYLAFITIFYLSQNRSTHLSFFHCLWDGSGNGKSGAHVHLIWISFNGCISILKGTTAVKLIQFNTVNNFLVHSWVIFSVKLLNCCCRAGDGGAVREMELCCLLMPALAVFCHSACLLQQYQGDLLISSSAPLCCSFARFILRAEVATTQRSRLWNCSFVQGTESSVPGNHSVYQCLSPMKLQLISRAVPGTSVFACWLNLTTCLCSD